MDTRQHTRTQVSQQTICTQLPFVGAIRFIQPVARYVLQNIMQTCMAFGLREPACCAATAHSGSSFFCTALLSSASLKTHISLWGQQPNGTAISQAPQELSGGKTWVNTSSKDCQHSTANSSDKAWLMICATYTRAGPKYYYESISYPARAGMLDRSYQQTKTP